MDKQAKIPTVILFVARSTSYFLNLTREQKSLAAPVLDYSRLLDLKTSEMNSSIPMKRGLNFINILQSAFSPVVLHQSNWNIRVGHFFWPSAQVKLSVFLLVKLNGTYRRICAFRHNVGEIGPYKWYVTIFRHFSDPHLHPPCNV